MDQALKQRLVGAVVLVALAVIFLPALFNGGRPDAVDTLKEIPPMPALEPIEVKQAQRPELPADSRPVQEMYTLEPTPEEVEESVEEATKAEPPGLTESGTPKAWVVQVGSFSDRDKADKFAADLQQQGYKSFTRTVQSNGKSITRVMIGPKLDKQSALVVKQKVDKQYQLKSLVIKFEV